MIFIIEWLISACFDLQLAPLSPSRRMHHNPRPRWLRRTRRAHGDRSETSGRDAGFSGLGAVAEEEQFGAARLSRSARRRRHSSRKYGPVLASRTEAGLEAGRDLQGRRIDPQPRPDGGLAKDQRASHRYRYPTDERWKSKKVRPRIEVLYRWFYLV